MKTPYQTKNHNTDVEVSEIFRVKIGEFVFEKDVEMSWINVYKITDEYNKLYLLEIDEDNITKIINSEDLKLFVSGWYFKNVSILEE